MKGKEVVKRMKEYALKNYDFGGDYIYECWQNTDYLEFYLEEPETWKERMQEIIEIMEDRRRFSL